MNGSTEPFLVEQELGTEEHSSALISNAGSKFILHAPNECIAADIQDNRDRFGLSGLKVGKFDSLTVKAVPLAILYVDVIAHYYAAAPQSLLKPGRVWALSFAMISPLLNPRREQCACADTPRIHCPEFGHL